MHPLLSSSAGSLLPLVLVFGSPLAAQTQVVVPNGYEDLEATSAARTPFGWSSGRVQYLVDGAQLCPTVALITELKLRLDGGNFNLDAPVAKTFQCTIDAYEVPVTPATMSASWANNLGSAVPTNVYNGPLLVPAATRQLPYPNPWSLSILLSQPLVYTRSNGNLLLDITVTGGSGDNWPADGFFFHATEARGEVTRIHEDAACATPSGSLALDVPQTLGNGVVGGTLLVAHTVSAAGGAALDFVFHVLSLDNQQSGGLPLPLSLAVLGAPACLLNIEPQLGVVVPTSAGGQTWTLPSAAGAIGVPVFTQALAIDFAGGALVPSRNSWQVRLGAPVPPAGPAQMVHRSNYTSQSTGSLSPTGYYGLVMAFVGTFQ
jgi:hypothetical protein